VIANDVGSIVLFNAEAARLFGVASDSMIGEPVERLIPERFARGHSRHRERFASEPQRRPMGSGLELRGRRGDGSEFPVEVSLSPLAMGERRFAMAALRDLSERVRIEEVQQVARTAQQASSAKTEFLSRMSHELRTPLNAILGFAQVLDLDPTQRLDKTQHHQIAHILRAGRHLLAMMNDLLDVTRIETGALSLSVEAVNVLELLDEVIAICEPAANEAAVTVECNVDPRDLCVQADRLRLRQVLLNLVTNGIKYNHRGGRVGVHASR
jgi:protein-histidine pros-kinase